MNWKNWSYIKRGGFIGFVIGFLIALVSVLSLGYCVRFQMGPPSTYCEILILIAKFTSYPLANILWRIWDTFEAIGILMPIIQLTILGFIVGWIFNKIKRRQDET
tara:strand:+ start:586 stop:900 length:315 start_codon:yes stop_codon:yes gene_type:complete